MAKTKAIKPPEAKRRRRRGRPAYRPTEATRRQVETLAGYGFPQDEIASFIDPPCDQKTLAKHFPKELKRGWLQAKAQTLGTLHRLANGAPATYYPADHPEAGKLMRGEQPVNVASLIFKCKTQYGMRETIRFGGEPDGAAIPLRIEGLTDAQVDQLLERLAAGTTGRGSSS